MGSGATQAPNCVFSLGREEGKRGSYNPYEGEDMLEGLF